MHVIRCFPLLDRYCSISYHTPPTLRQILKEYSEGGGGDDWAIEEIARKDAEGKAELLAALANKRMRKHFNAAVQLLLLCFSWR